MKLCPVLSLALVVAGSWTLGAQLPASKDQVSPDHAARMAKGLDVFKKHVRPLLEQKCLRCHGGREVEGELDLSDRALLLKGGQSGPAIIPGKSKESLLVKLVTHAREPHMPKGASKLPAADLAHLVNWIDLGAPYDNPLAGSKIKPRPWTDKVLPADARNFWSFQPLAQASLPAVKKGDWCKTPVDRFVLAKLEQAGVTPNPEATRQQLLRRAYFDLIGLPPTPEEANAFLKDTSPQAWEKLIDRLLDSPHYGERWARHWLDLARFAESHGFEHDYDRPSAYPYRDFVIEALNRDLPYDTFVKWQIAGDEYEPDNPLALKATGFLAAGVHSTQITKSEVEKHRYDELDDKLATLGTAFLGLTIGCARCHDHKYDPIPQRDYYRMLATFTTTVRSEIELNLDAESYQRAKAEFDRAHQPFVAAVTKFEREQLAARFAAWEKSRPRLDDFPWEVVELKGVKSRDGATLTLQSDGSILASGKNPRFDVYTITAQTYLTDIRALRLEALAHPSMVKGGPGRAANGNFALSDFKVVAAPAKGTAAAAPVALKRPRATFEQKGLPVAAAIDNDARSAWAVDPQFGKDHAAVFETEPFGQAKGATLTFTLKFNNNDGHNLGRIRLSVSTVQDADLRAPGMPAQVRRVLALPAAQRNPEQTAVLLHWYKHLDPEWRVLEQKRLDHLAQAPKPKTVKCLVATEDLPAVRLHTQGEDFLPETHFLRRGDPANKEGVATQSFLQVLMPAPDAEKRWQTPPPAGWRTSYRRRALAEWLCDTRDGAGLLLARVIVNRLWQHHLGRGLVATPSDFGSRGERPTHPELLDYLARELIKNGWRLKPIHKLIMTSAVYRVGAQYTEANAQRDPDNKLFWRRPPRRLEAEVIRDSLLAVSGELDRTMFGPGTLDEKSKRRSIYFTVKRSKLMPMMVIFDAPEALSGMADRPTTTIAPQALHLLNNPQVRLCSLSFARRVAGDGKTPLEAVVAVAYHTALARPPRPDEVAEAVQFLRAQLSTYSGPDQRERAIADFCQVLLCLNEFVYVE